MATDRIKLLQKFVEEDPGDPFNLYALALEYLGSDQLKARAFFDTLLQDHKAYLPTYYHAAKLFQDLGEKERAKRTYEDGISLARNLNDGKALRELRSAFDELMFE
jgi:tetratricopeptide (TPR) repeat protein